MADNGGRYSKGFLFMLIATLGFATMHSCIKLLSEFHLSQIIFFRCFITVIFSTFVLTKNKISFKGNNPKLLLLRSVLGIISMISFFITLQTLPIGVSVSLMYLSPAFALIFALIFLREKMLPVMWIFFATALLGTIFLKGLDSRIDLVSFILGIVGAISAGAVFVVIRRIGKTEHSMVIVNYFMVLGSILSAIVMLLYWKTPSFNEALIFLFVGGFGCWGQVYMTKAFQVELASKVAPIKYMEIVFSFISGYLFFGEKYSYQSVFSLSAIIVSLFMIVLFSTKKHTLT